MAAVKCFTSRLSHEHWIANPMGGCWHVGGDAAEVWNESSNGGPASQSPEQHQSDDTDRRRLPPIRQARPVRTVKPSRGQADTLSVTSINCRCNSPTRKACVRHNWISHPSKTAANSKRAVEDSDTKVPWSAMGGRTYLMGGRVLIGSLAKTGAGRRHDGLCHCWKYRLGHFTEGRSRRGRWNVDATQCYVPVPFVSDGRWAI